MKRRLLQAVPTLLGITFVSFALMQLAPGHAYLASEGTVGANSQAIEAWRALRGEDLPITTQYWRWLSRIVQLDFGRSLVNETPVRELLAEALPTTLLVCGLALLLAYAVAIPLGVFLSLSQRKHVTRWLSRGLFALHATPPFWLALVLLVLLASGEYVTWLPLRGLAPSGVGLFEQAWHLLLPVVCLALPFVARTSQHVKSAVSEALREPHVRTAYAKGLPAWRVLLSHVAPRALVPVLAVLSVDLPSIVGGSVVMERMFTLPGMGMLTFDAILKRDVPVLLGVVTVVALVTMASVLVVDLAQHKLDPRGAQS